MQDQAKQQGWAKPIPTAVLVMADGTVIEGFGLGAAGKAVGEVCFNTAMTGYQEILTDPSYAGQIVTFTFPHIGNVGVNDEDVETVDYRPRAGRARRGRAGADRRSRRIFAPRRTFDALAEGARDHRAGGRRHPRPDRADPRKGHAQCGHRL